MTFAIVYALSCEIGSVAHVELFVLLVRVLRLRHINVLNRCDVIIDHYVVDSIDACCIGLLSAWVTGQGCLYLLFLALLNLLERMAFRAHQEDGAIVCGRLRPTR